MFLQRVLLVPDDHLRRGCDSFPPTKGMWKQVIMYVLTWFCHDNQLKRKDLLSSQKDHFVGLVLQRCEGKIQFRTRVLISSPDCYLCQSGRLMSPPLLSPRRA